MFSMNDSRLLNFDVKSDPNNLGHEWQKWLRSFRYFIVGQDITSPERTSALLLHLAGPEVQEIYDTLDPLPGESGLKEDEVVIGRLNNYFLPKTNMTYERHIFRSIKQEPGESFDQFLTRLRLQAKKCGFSNLNENVKDQIVDGCKDSNFRRKVLERGNIATLDDVIKLAQTLEVTCLQAKSYQNPEVNRVSHKPFQRKAGMATENKPVKSSPQNSASKCYRCNKTGHFSNSPNCPAREKTCNKCKKKGHFSICCKTKMHRVNHVEDAHGKSDTRQSMNYAFSIQPNEGKTINCVVGGINLSLLVDTGASVNVVDTPTWSSLKEKGIECESWKYEDQIFSYGHKTGLPVIGKFSAHVSHGQKSVEAEFLVFEGVPILSLGTAKDLEVLKIVTALSKR